MLLSALIAASTLAACDRPTVVNVPATPVAVPGPAGPAGSKGDPGKPGEGSTIIVVPPAASAPAN
jgi:hypothetical protein